MTFKGDVHTDVFPAMLVVSPPGAPTASIYTQTRTLASYGAKRLEAVRVLVTSTHVLIFDEGDGSGPRLIYNQPLQSFTRAKQRSHRIEDERRSMHPESTVTLDDGTTLAFYKQPGCGCGSRLKSFNTFNTLQKLAAS